MIKKKYGWRLRWPLVATVAVATWFAWPSIAYHVSVAAWNRFPEESEALVAHAIVFAGGNFPEAQVLRSRILLHLNDNKEAIGSWLTVQDFGRCSHQSLLQLSTEAFEKGEIHLALSVAAKSHVQFTDSIHSTRILSLGNAAISNFREAEKWTALWVATVPSSSEAWLCRMEVLSSLLQVNAAIEAGEKALKLEPKFGVELSVRRRLSELFLSISDGTSSTAHCKWVLAHAPEAQQSDYVRIASALRIERDFDNAMKNIETALEKTPGESRALMIRGLLHADVQHHELAVRDFHEVVKKEPSHRDATYKLARSLAKLGRRDEAEMYLQKAEAFTAKRQR